MEYKYKTLLELEKKRQFLNNSSFTNSLLSSVFIILFLVLIVIFYGQYFNYKDKIFLFILIILAIKLLFSTSKELRTNKSKDFNKEFKNYFLKPYLENKGFIYKPYYGVEKIDLIRSRLFREFDYENGDDTISGEINGVKFYFGDIVLKNLKQEKDSYSFLVETLIPAYHSRKRTDIVFKGIFFKADFNKFIDSSTFIMSFGTPKGNLKKIKVDNALFNEKFRVFSDDIQNAFYILTPAFMERVLELYNHFKTDISISFLKGIIYIAIETGINSFEPDITKSLITQNPAKNIIKDIEKILKIVEILRINSENHNSK
ncbi:DUF3137 domain-containing protein [Campylobacter ureolyticus]|uniref:DUF3137 domain-containing protein n=1 Tax=Campylobacter ureolyticus TaxID=827 RepID=UPI001FC877BC|nr:DUF3137 domain-containing protein [Campylobacter ureolyticus]MCZ6106154.1 DUF3137 domain-containing protein [Campylobacter ureolyticus]MCZ6157045.1 DUF3137 domain-containing protein [Campylobacter ureolyticus]GKH59676.1 hypothetical protein CE91St25_00120 [Campylobacter ureolyticus]